MEPGRLYVGTRASNFGATPPCEGFIKLYINKYSKVRIMELQLSFSRRSGEILHEENHRLELKETGFGMFQNEVPLNAIEGENCRNIIVSIRSLECISADGSAIDCPQTGLVTTYVYLDFNIEDSNIDVCYTNN
jgi:hypothetical protein